MGLPAYNAERAAGISYIKRPSMLLPLSTLGRRLSPSASGLRSSGFTLPSIKDEPVGRSNRQHMQSGRHKQAWLPLRPPADLRSLCPDARAIDVEALRYRHK